MKARLASLTVASGLFDLRAVCTRAYRGYPPAVASSSPVVALIPTYRPADSLVALSARIAAQVDSVVISDDASPCTFDATLRQAGSLDGVTTIRHQWNRGIARGLNDGLSIAREHGAIWLLTVDQDSLVGGSYVAEMVATANRRVQTGEHLGALGAGVVADASGAITYPLIESGEQATTHEVIQTGTLWNVTALDRVGGFDEDLGIDGVDAAACLRLRQAGYRIGVVESTRIDHAIGSSRMMEVAGRKIMVTGHSPERRSSMLRNRLLLFPEEFRQSPRHAVRTVRRVAVNQLAGLFLEEQRWEKTKGSIRGLVPKRTR